MVLVGDHSPWAPGAQVLEDDVSGRKAVVVARTDDPGKAGVLVRRHHPDVVVVDDRLAVVRELSGGPARVLVLSHQVDAEAALAALRAGADGFLPATVEPVALVPSLLALASGLSVLPAGILAVVAGTQIRRDRGASESLSPDERELWRMVAGGLDLAHISDRLFVSERTAKRMVASLLRRLRVANRVQAAALAGQCGLLDEVPPA